MKVRAFISHSRKDAAFTRRLSEALVARGYAPDYDRSERDPANIDTGISAEDEWWQRIKSMITAAEATIIVGSPDLANSKVCAEEIAYARNLGKRIIPILYRAFDYATAPPRLSALTFKIEFIDGADEAFSAALDQLCAVLNVDVAWHRESRRLTELAVRWEDAERLEGLLLTAADVRAVGSLLERRPREAPEPSQILLELRDRSREKLDADDTKQRRIIGSAFVRPAEEAVRAGRHEHALRLAAAGVTLSQDTGFTLVPELWAPACVAVAKRRIRSVLRGHGGSVTSCAFSLDGRWVVTTSDDETARVWETATGKEISVIKPSLGTLASGAFSPDSRWIALTSDDKRAIIWAADGTHPIPLCKSIEGRLRHASFSPDSSRLVTTHAIQIARVWDVKAQIEIARLTHSATLIHASFSHDGKMVLTTAWDGTAQVWDCETGTKVRELRGHSDLVLTGMFSPDDRRILTASDDKTIKIWDLLSGNEIYALSGSSGFFSPDGRKVVMRGRDIRIWDNSGKEMTDQFGKATSIAFSADGARCVLASGHTGRMSDGETGAEVCVLHGHDDKITSVDFSPDGRTIVTASLDETARLWDANSSDVITVKSDASTSPALAVFSPDSTLLLIRLSNDSVSVIDTATGRQIGLLACRGVHQAEFSADNLRVLLVTEEIASVWDVQAATQIAELVGHTDRVNSAALVNEQKQIVTASNDGSVRLWDADTGDQLFVKQHSDPVWRAVPSPHGTVIVTLIEEELSELSAEVLDAKDLRLLKHLSGYGASDTASALAFSSDGARLVTTCWTFPRWRRSDRIDDRDTSDTRIAVAWDANGWQLLSTIRGTFDSTKRWSTSANGQRVAASDWGGLMVWELPTGLVKTFSREQSATKYGVAFSPDGRWLIETTRGRIGLWDVEQGIQVIELDIPGDQVAFSPNGRSVVVNSRGTVSLWDVSRLDSFAGNRAAYLAAGLANGVGMLTPPEREDLLLNNASADLFDELIRLMPDQRHGAEQIINALGMPFHRNCYLSPSQFSGLHQLKNMPPEWVYSGVASVQGDEPPSDTEDFDSISPIEAASFAPPTPVSKLEESTLADVISLSMAPTPLAAKIRENGIEAARKGILRVLHARVAVLQNNRRLRRRQWGYGLLVVAMISLAATAMIFQQSVVNTLPR